MAFNFPASYAFTEDSSEGYRSWNFDGSDFVIGLFELASGTLDEMVNGMVEKFEKKNCKTTVINKKLGAFNLTGKRIAVTLADTKVSVDVFELPLKNGKATFLVFTDTKDEKGNDSAECKETLRVLDNTVKYQ